MAPLKVFISFKSEDESLAEALYVGLTEAGALVYQFRRTAKPGTSAWNVLLDWISDSDVFVAFISRSSLKSRPVAEEIDHAHYEFVNTKRPARLIPVLVEPGLRPPVILRRFSTYTLNDPTTGIPALIAEVLRAEERDEEREMSADLEASPDETTPEGPTPSETSVATSIPVEPATTDETFRSSEKQVVAGEDEAAGTVRNVDAPGVISSRHHERDRGSARPHKKTPDKPKPKRPARESSRHGEVTPEKPTRTVTKERKADRAVRVRSQLAVADPRANRTSTPAASRQPGLSVARIEPNSVSSLASYLFAVVTVISVGAILAGLVADWVNLLADRFYTAMEWAAVVQPVLNTVGRWAAASPWWGRITLLVMYLFSFVAALGFADEERPIDTSDYLKVSGRSLIAACIWACIWVALFSRADVALLDSAVSWIGWLPTPWASGSVWSRMTAGAVYVSGVALVGYAVSRETGRGASPAA